MFHSSLIHYFVFIDNFFTKWIFYRRVCLFYNFHSATSLFVSKYFDFDFVLFYLSFLLFVNCMEIFRHSQAKKGKSKREIFQHWIVLVIQSNIYTLINYFGIMNFAVFYLLLTVALPDRLIGNLIWCPWIDTIP